MHVQDNFQYINSLYIYITLILISNKTKHFVDYKNTLIQ